MDSNADWNNEKVAIGKVSLSCCRSNNFQMKHLQLILMIKDTTNLDLDNYPLDV